MSEMVERVARAIYDSHRFHLSWGRASQEWRTICERQARAAIAAMREPTEAMVDAGVSQTGSSRRAVEITVRAAIDAALND